MKTLRETSAGFDRLSTREELSQVLGLLSHLTYGTPDQEKPYLGLQADDDSRAQVAALWGDSADSTEPEGQAAVDLVTELFLAERRRTN
jgi:hypothetical protein